MKIKQKEDVWQVVLELECKGITAGYGFGESPGQAEANARKMWDIRMQQD